MRAGASDDELREIIGTTWLQRDDGYSEMRAGHSPAGHSPSGHSAAQRKIEMHYIGG
jgi:hypothetical protein